MEYMWYSVLNRKEDFWEQTPKYYSSQVEAYKKFHGNKDEEDKRPKRNNDTEAM